MAHKVVLAARSSVFAKLTDNLNGKEQFAVKIPDFEDDVIRGLLEYLYTGETAFVSKHALELLQLAVKYELPELKENCESALAESLNVENAGELLVAAHVYQASILMPRVINFIKFHKDYVCNTAAFKKAALDYPRAVVTLYLSE